MKNEGAGAKIEEPTTGGDGMSWVEMEVGTLHSISSSQGDHKLCGLRLDQPLLLEQR